jgi:glycosyltransferase involved in cell wall biosynthesis
MLATGRDPPQEPIHEDVIFAGPVPDLAPYLKNADSAVTPLQKGGGTSMEILEYFAAGVPVIATSKAMEGITVENVVQAWIEDGFEAMADVVVTLLQDRPRADRLVSAARGCAPNRDWTATARRYLEPVRWDLAPNAAGAVGSQDETPQAGMQHERPRAGARNRDA